MSIKAMDWAFERQLPPGERFTLVAICDNASEKDGEFVAWPSVGLISGKTGHAWKTVQEHIRSLDAKGYITRRARFSKTGGQTTTEYRINLPTDTEEARGPH